tara:strand:+ start:2300 stop:3775 length:1476 start_codon:yes stop_codon:yes gene_type:complete
MCSQQKHTDITHYKPRWKGVPGLDGDVHGYFVYIENELVERGSWQVNFFHENGRLKTDDDEDEEIDTKASRSDVPDDDEDKETATEAPSSAMVLQEKIKHVREQIHVLFISCICFLFPEEDFTETDRPIRFMLGTGESIPTMEEDFLSSPLCTIQEFVSVSNWNQISSEHPKIGALMKMLRAIMNESDFIEKTFLRKGGNHKKLMVMPFKGELIRLLKFLMDPSKDAWVTHGFEESKRSYDKVLWYVLKVRRLLKGINELNKNPDVEDSLITVLMMRVQQIEKKISLIQINFDHSNAYKVITSKQNGILKYSYEMLKLPWKQRDLHEHKREFIKLSKSQQNKVRHLKKGKGTKICIGYQRIFTCPNCLGAECENCDNGKVSCSVCQLVYGTNLINRYCQDKQKSNNKGKGEEPGTGTCALCVAYDNDLKILCTQCKEEKVLHNFTPNSLGRQPDANDVGRICRNCQAPSAGTRQKGKGTQPTQGKVNIVYK